MFCENCRQLLDFRHGFIRYTPQKRPLGGDTKALIIQQHQRQKNTNSNTKFEILEDFSPNPTKPVWWKTPFSQDGSFLVHSASTGCRICSMIFTNVSRSVVRGIVEKPFENRHDPPAFVYKLTSPNFLQNSLQEPDYESLSKDRPKDSRKLRRERRARMILARTKHLGSTLSVWLEVDSKLLPMIELQITVGYGKLTSSSFSDF